MALRFQSYAQLKEALAQSIVDTLSPIQDRYAEISKEKRHLAGVRLEGAERARDRAARTVRRAKHAIGLLA